MTYDPAPRLPPQARIWQPGELLPEGAAARRPPEVGKGHTHPPAVDSPHAIAVAPPCRARPWAKSMAPREVAAQRTDRNGIWMDGRESYQNNRR